MTCNGTLLDAPGRPRPLQMLRSGMGWHTIHKRLQQSEIHGRPFGNSLSGLMHLRLIIGCDPQLSRHIVQDPGSLGLRLEVSLFKLQSLRGSFR